MTNLFGVTCSHHLPKNEVLGIVRAGIVVWMPLLFPSNQHILSVTEWIQLSYTGFANFTGDEKTSPNVQISDYFYHFISMCTITFYVSLSKLFSIFVRSN